LQLGSRATKTGVEVCPAVQPIFDTLKFPINNDDTLIDFQDALDQINLGEMPPEDQPQPKAKEKRAVVKWPAATIKQYQASRESTGSETVLRRLNRREHFNTVRDLFHLDTSHFDPTADFPADQETHHLNNQGSELVPKTWQFDGGFKQGGYLGGDTATVPVGRRHQSFSPQGRGKESKQSRDSQACQEIGLRSHPAS